MHIPHAHTRITQVDSITRISPTVYVTCNARLAVYWAPKSKRSLFSLSRYAHPPRDAPPYTPSISFPSALPYRQNHPGPYQGLSSPPSPSATARPTLNLHHAPAPAYEPNTARTRYTLLLQQNPTRVPSDSAAKKRGRSSKEVITAARRGSCD